MGFDTLSTRALPSSRGLLPTGEALDNRQGIGQPATANPLGNRQSARQPPIWLTRGRL
jgi:hypothetical protein